MVFYAVMALSLVLYALWAAWVPLLPSNLYVPLLDLGKITGYRWSSALIFLAIVLGLYLLYGIGYWLVPRSQPRIGTVVAAAAAFCAALVFAYPATAVDVFGYEAHGRLLAFHNANPFTTAPAAFPTDDIITYLAFPNEPSQYGPVWVLLNGALAKLANGDLLIETLLYKLLAALAHLGSGTLVYLIARRLSEPILATRCAFVYLCNPMLLWEMIGNAHNDGLMMLFGLLAVYLLITRIDLLVLPALMVGALVKIPVIIVAPLLFFALLRRGVLRAIEGALLALFLAAAVYRPFWDGPDTLTALRRTDLFTASLGSVIRLALEPVYGLTDASTIARWISLGGFTMVFVFALVLSLGCDDDQCVLRLAYFSLLGALLLLTTWFQTWYVVWPLALGAALPEPKRHAELALLSLGGLLQYFVFIYLWVMGYFPPTENLAVQLTAYLAIIGPIVVFIVVPRLWEPARARVPPGRS